MIVLNDDKASLAEARRTVAVAVGITRRNKEHVLFLNKALHHRGEMVFDLPVIKPISAVSAIALLLNDAFAFRTNGQTF